MKTKCCRFLLIIKPLKLFKIKATPTFYVGVTFIIKYQTIQALLPLFFHLKTWLN
jgi:hypothetical protein